MQFHKAKSDAARVQHAKRRKAVAPAPLTTDQILAQRYGTALVPIDRIREDYFPEYNRLDHLLEAIKRRDIDGFPEISRLNNSGKGTKFVRLADFAVYLDTAPRPVSLPVSQD